MEATCDNGWFVINTSALGWFVIIRLLFTIGSPGFWERPPFVSIDNTVPPSTVISLNSLVWLRFESVTKGSRVLQCDTSGDVEPSGACDGKETTSCKINFRIRIWIFNVLFVCERDSACGI